MIATTTYNPTDMDFCKNPKKFNISRCRPVGRAPALGLRERLKPPNLENPHKHWVLRSFKSRFLGFDPIFDHNCGTWFFKSSLIQFNISGCGAVGSARHLGCRCRRFEPCHSDHTECSYSNREVFCKNTLFRFHILTNCFYTAVVAGVAAGT